MIRTPHKEIQGEVGRSREGVVTGIRERGPPLSRLIKHKGYLLIRDRFLFLWKDHVYFFHT